MPSPIPSPIRPHLRGLAKRRGAGVVFALLLEALILLALLSFTPTMRGGKQQGSLFTFDVAPTNDASREQKQANRETRRARPAEQKPQPKPPEPVPTPEPPIELPPSVIRMTSRDFATTDVQRFARSPAASSSTPSQGDSDAEPDSALAGRGSQGQPLYAAEWYRRPTDAELSPYLPRRARGPGWGAIECRTIANFRVDDCRELGESPTGSGYAGAVRQAAWQFRIRPPRVGGKVQVGTWVSIQITYSEKGGKLGF